MFAERVGDRAALMCCAHWLGLSGILSHAKPKSYNQLVVLLVSRKRCAGITFRMRW
jgi:hypothetical protein